MVNIKNDFIDFVYMYLMMNLNSILVINYTYNNTPGYALIYLFISKYKLIIYIFKNTHI
jgi:hypothetical protein